jgi:hypothetical protein
MEKLTTIQQVNSTIMFGDFTNVELESIIDAVKWRRNQITQQNKRALRVGDHVKFRNSRTGMDTFGVVKKINIKYILVTEQKSNSLIVSTWRVPANMLEAV